MSNPEFSQSSFTQDDLIAGSFPRKTRSVTIISGQNLAKGAVLGKITASAKYNLSLAAAGDGSGTAVAVLAEAVDASAGDVVGTAYLTGDFNAQKVVIGTGHTIASLKDGFGMGCFLSEPVEESGQAA